jgi:hypothetical protein
VAPSHFASLDEITQVCLVMTPHECGVRAWRPAERMGVGVMLGAIRSGRFRVEEFPWWVAVAAGTQLHYLAAICADGRLP